MIPRNPNKAPKVKLTGVKLSKFLANRIERALKKVPAENRGFVFALTRASMEELETVPAAVESVATAETEF